MNAVRFGGCWGFIVQKDVRVEEYVGIKVGCVEVRELKEIKEGWLKS